MGHQIEEVDTRVAPESVLRDMHEHEVLDEAEQLPGDPPEPFEQRLADWRNRPSHKIIRRWTLREDGEIVAMAFLNMEKDEDLNNGFTRIHVRPDARRRGLATALATPVFDAMEESGRKSVITEAVDGVEWEAKLKELGLKKSLQDKRSRLVVADLDWDLMTRWIEQATERADGYEILYLTTPIPEEHLKHWCEVLHVMHTAPKEDLDFEDSTWTPEKWRDSEASYMRSGNQFLAHVAVDRETGEFVGLSEIIFQEYHPTQAWQGDTGVHPDHRNKGLGRWLKAATIQRVMDEHPEIARIDTFNAGSNEAMLAINVEMGYSPVLISNAWQGDLAMVRERLGA